MNNDFFEINIEFKKKDLQKEHMDVLEEIYEHYKKTVTSSVCTQYYLYSDICSKMKEKWGRVYK